MNWFSRGPCEDDRDCTTECYWKLREIRWKKHEALSPRAGDSHELQRLLLEAEGVGFVGDRVDLKTYRWEEAGGRRVVVARGAGTHR
jgi:hypothetical protein